MWQLTKEQNILYSFIVWHYNFILRQIVIAWKNILEFNMNYFSIVFLLRTFFYPWRNQKIHYTKGFDFYKLIDTITFNLFSRLMGAIMRFVIIITGIITQVIILIGGTILILLWIFIPIIIIIGGILTSIWLILI